MKRIKDIEYIKIKDIKKYENNPKNHSQRQLKLLEKSIEEFGFLSPCLIDEENNLIAGHGRTEAAENIGMKEIPCVRVEGLTEEQRKAYIIADNRLTELGTWDKDILANELAVLDMSQFDVDLTGFDIDSVLESIDKPYGAERQRTIDAYNMEINDYIDSTNDFWQMPIIENDNFIPSNLIGFNYAKTSKNKATGIHFFVDDYQFERIWNDPDKYIDILKEYECILSPDFSLYMDMDMPTKIWNIYRSRKIGAYYQSCGIKVIPTISWAEKETYDFCFLGIPKNSTVAVSTVGVKENEGALEVWTDGMKAMIEKISPKTILVYGGKLDFDYGDIKVVYFDNHVLKEWKDRSNERI